MRKQAFKYLILVVSLLLLTTIVNAAPLQDGSANWNIEEATAVRTGRGLVVEPKGATGSAIYMVQLSDASLAHYRGNIGGLQATSIQVTGAHKLDANSPSSKAYLAYLAERRAGAIARANAVVGRQLTVAFEYRATFNGFAAEMTPEEARAVATVAGVVRVERERMFELHTDAGPAWIGAPSIWDGSATGDAGTRGEGIIVGVIDTGIDPWNPSFAATGDDGYTHTNPFGAGKYVGVCDPANTNPPEGVVAYDPTFPCNDKLIGAWGYTPSDPNPRDGDGHGSHTASTAAGNVVIDSVVTSPTAVYTATISGVAPHANIIMYDGCIDGGGCPGFSLAAARDQALLDGVDVINYSIGASAPTGDPFNDVESLQWLALRDAGVFVATSAGNAGPGDATIGSPADLPWLTSVGASSHNRAFLQTVTLEDGVNAPLALSGRAMANGYGPAEIVFAADYADPDNGITEDDARLCADGVFAPGTFSGQIVVCERGVYGRVAKGQTVFDGGAGGMILAQPNEFGGGPGALNADPHVLPAIHIDYATYQQLLDYMAAAGGAVQGTLGNAVLDVNDSHGDIMAAFSSRGENGTFADVIVPSVTGPGRDIWAAYHQGPAGDGDFTWNVISGTSMSSPHVAGTGALMKAVHPDWSPAQIQSALMMTADLTVLNDDGVNQATPFAMGSGRINVAAAAQAGLVLDVTTAEYEAANPAEGGDPGALNLASLGNGACVESCSWTRTVQATKAESWTASLNLPTGATGTITPETFTLAAGETAVVTVEVNVLGLTAGEWSFGWVVLTPAGDTPAAHMPIAVRPETGDLPDSVVITAARDAGSVPVTNLTAITVHDLTATAVGLAKATVTEFELRQDPTNDIPEGFYDDLSQVFWMPIEVPADSYSLVADVLSSESPDIDMAVGQDLDGDGPELSEQVCQSAGGSWTEFCEVPTPAAGTWWVLVLNWTESVNAPDAISLATAVVPNADAGNLRVEGPMHVPALEPFDIRVFWDTPGSEAGDRYYGAISLGTSPETAGNLGTIPVYMTRVADDVTKSASTDAAMPGDTITYMVTVNPNVLPEDISYVITDTLPAGVTYVEGSASASAGTVSVANGVVTWEGDMISLSNLAPSYTMTTSDTDPTCDTGFGGYVDLQAFGIVAQPAITGDTVGFTAFSSGNPINYFGVDYQGMGFTDDGFTIFDINNNYGGAPWFAQTVPDAALPNNLIAAMWQDMEIFYDQANNHGVSLATAGAPGGVVIVEYDDAQFFGGSTDTFDFEVVVWRGVDDAPGAYEVIVAYDNLNGSLAGPLTVGVENVDGTAATALVNNGSAEGVLHNGLMVCYDLNAPSADLVTITYAVTVDAGALSDVVNTAVSSTTNAGSQEASSSATVEIINPNAPSCDLASGFNVIYGTTGADNLIGTPGNDIIIGYGGNDRIDGREGNDCLVGGLGNDRLYGNDGYDILWGGEVDNAMVYDVDDQDRLFGGDDDDQLHGGGDVDRVDGGDGDDSLWGDDGSDYMISGDGNDVMYGGNGDDKMHGNNGNDRVYGEAGDDKLYGRKGDDLLNGGEGVDRLYGDSGLDTCVAGERLFSCEQ